MHLTGDKEVFTSGRITAGPSVLRGASRPDLLRNETLAEILSATAKRLPQKNALIWGEQSVSYGELDSLSNAIGASLIQRSAASGKVIGLFLPRGADLLIAQAGITKAMQRGFHSMPKLRLSA